MDWPNTWNLANLKGLNPTEKTFLWRMLHNILPTQARLFHLRIRNTPTPNCLLCDTAEPADLTHSLLTCPVNAEVYRWLMRVLHHHIPHLQPEQVVLLDVGPLDETLCLPIVWLIGNTLSLIWDDRREKKHPRLHKTRSTLEAKINILRKSRFSASVPTIENVEGLSRD